MKAKFPILVCLFLFMKLVSFSQTSSGGFKIIENGSVPLSEIASYEKAIASANMENYRYKSSPDTLEFMNGLKFVLISAHELFILEKKINPTTYSEKIKGYQMPKFSLTKEGTLVALYTHKEK